MSNAKIATVDPSDESKALEEFKKKVPTLEGKNGLLILLGMTSSQGVPGAVVDINNIEKVFKSEEVNFAVWRIENPTKEQIPAVMKVVSSQSYPDTIDKVFVYYSGHGGNHNGQKFIIPHAEVGEVGVRSYIKEDIIMFFEPPPVSKLGPNVKRVYLFDSCLSPGKVVGSTVPKVEDASFGDLRQPLLIGHSTSMEEKAKGKPSDGGEWTNALCKFIRELPYLPFSYILDKTWKEVVKSTSGGQYVQGPHYLNYMGLFFLKDEYKAQFYDNHTVEAVKSGKGGSQPPSSVGGGGGGGAELPEAYGGDMPDLEKIYNVTPDQADMKAALKDLGETDRDTWRRRFGGRLKGPSGTQINFCTKLEYLIENMYTYRHPFSWGVVLYALDNPVPITGKDRKMISTSVREYMAKNYAKYAK
ncbi:PREDICTED: uncharacterized protein LOC100637049 [Amphimedon queenslandica]|uniref:Peptidase C14 caspase domain-containing protein n=1 Tax=Amphimedon queenslandica TaxID=400682 RepID=A0A1X7U4Z3_AMPQE|nr:PREDICTED: uncharacterized protein LOC100637049 [Amphimedon queenslandica]|eukprot:XP_003388944.2 PREDICTED: uncharacterized protein LOC100637049 [Amphimedon queenslandica]